MLVTVVCDACEWQKEKQTAEDWLNQRCPKCRHKYIVDDTDLAILEQLKTMQRVFNGIKGFYPNAKTKTVRISTADIKAAFNDIF